MTGETIPLGMAGNAAFQVLAGSLAVIQEEELFGVVIAAAERGAGRHAGLQVTVGAELSGIVAIGAASFAGVSRGRMAGEEPRRVVSGSGVRRVRPMTVQTLRPDMAAIAALGSGSGRRAMDLGKIRSMRRRPLAPDDRPPSPAGPSHRQGLDSGWRADVTGEAALLGMAGSAGGGGFPHGRAVMGEKRRVGMAGRRLQLRPSRERARIRCQGLDHGQLGRVHVTLAAEIPGMARGAGRRYTA